MKKDNVLDLPNADKAKADLAMLKRELPNLIAQQAIIANLRIASFRAHIAEGFTEQQALTLCIHPAIVPVVK